MPALYGGSICRVCENLRTRFCGWLLWEIYFMWNKGKSSPQELYLCVIHICGLDYLGKNSTKKRNFPSRLYDLSELNLSLLRQIKKAHLRLYSPHPGLH